MRFPRTNVEEKLIRYREKSYSGSEEFDVYWKNQIKIILEKDDDQEEAIVSELKKNTPNAENAFVFDELDTSKIYHIDHIQRICVDYRLRFLDTRYFKGKIPKTALSKIKDLEETHQTQLKGYKIIAPSKLFKLENADDPLLFAPMGNDYYYLIHKWGNDLNPWRKSLMWFFKSFENLIVLIVLVSILCTLLVPQGLFTRNTDFSSYLMIFFFMFKSVAAVVLYYGFAAGKNFNGAIWNSKYFNA